MEDYLLEMKGISKTFPGVIALHEVSLFIKYGEVHALMGENGAGKSTLIKVLTGIYQTAFPRICIPFSLNFFPAGKSGSVFGGRDAEELEDTALQGG